MGNITYRLFCLYKCIWLWSSPRLVVDDSVEEKKRIDNLVRSSFERTFFNPKMVVCQDVLLHNSKRVPIVHTEEYMDIMKHMINFPMKKIFTEC